MKKLVIAVLMLSSCLALASAPRTKAKPTATKAVESSKAATPEAAPDADGLGISGIGTGTGSGGSTTAPSKRARKMTTAVDTSTRAK
jgi:hypothetical protein